MGRRARQGHPGPHRPRPAPVPRPAAQTQVQRSHHPTTDGGLEEDEEEDEGGVRGGTISTSTDAEVTPRYQLWPAPSITRTIATRRSVVSQK